MGQARRRKRAGTYPGAGPVEDYRVPNGQFGITINVAGADHPVTIILPTDKLAEVTQRAHQLCPPGVTFPSLVRALAEQFISALRIGGKLDGIGIGVAMTALYHPQHGAKLRAAVSQNLRKNGRAHVTWTFDLRHGLAIAVADHFVELDNLLAKMPADAPPIAVVAPSASGPSLQ